MRKQEKMWFADELTERIDTKVMAFLKVVSRGIELSLSGCSGLPQRALVVPGMILAVTAERDDDKYVVYWCGPAFQTDSNASLEKPRYSEETRFILEVPKDLIRQGKIVRVRPSRVRKMKHHVPAVLFNTR
jgi:hypothetical protein